MQSLITSPRIQSTAPAHVKPACYWCDGTTDVRSYRNGWDNNSTISLCRACLSPRPVTECAA